MPLDPAFFVPDARGMVSAMEFAFTSTSKDRDQALEFAEGGQTAILFEIKSCARDASGFHCGIDLSWCSDNPDEEETLFPPFTLFRVLAMRRERNDEEDRNDFILEVCPTWLAGDEPSSFFSLIK